MRGGILSTVSGASGRVQGGRGGGG
eukprot:COSAG05_NODE_14212_length_404_cov_0.832787_1_plen_24_part_01